VGDHELPRAEDRLASGRPVAGALAYREWGDADAPTLIFWPGLQLPAHVMLNEHGPALAAASGRRVLAISPPGWETPPLAAAEYRPAALARRLVGLFDELEATRVTFVGFSWGATIGCHLAATAPERLDAIVLLDAGYTDAQDRPGFAESDLATVTVQMAEQAREFRWSSWEECFAFFRPHVPQWSASYERRLRVGLREEEGAIVPVVSPEVAAAAAYGVAAEPPSATLPRLGRLALPILLVAASETVATEHGARALARFCAAVPAAEVVELESGHDLLLDTPEATIAAVSAFLRDASPRDVSQA
jgi:pimeloyl-ACP methyl ester carboxylesterase